MFISDENVKYTFNIYLTSANTKIQNKLCNTPQVIHFNIIISHKSICLENSQYYNFNQRNYIQKQHIINIKIPEEAKQLNMHKENPNNFFDTSDLILHTQNKNRLGKVFFKDNYLSTVNVKQFGIMLPAALKGNHLVIKFDVRSKWIEVLQNIVDDYHEDITLAKQPQTKAINVLIQLKNINFHRLKYLQITVHCQSLKILQFLGLALLQILTFSHIDIIQTKFLQKLGFSQLKMINIDNNPIKQIDANRIKFNRQNYIQTFGQFKKSQKKSYYWSLYDISYLAKIQTGQNQSLQQRNQLFENYSEVFQLYEYVFDSEMNRQLSDKFQKEVKLFKPSNIIERNKVYESIIRKYKKIHMPFRYQVS